MKKEEIKRNVVKIMNDIINGNKNPQLGIEEIEDVLNDVEEIKEFIIDILSATKNFVI